MIQTENTILSILKSFKAEIRSVINQDQQYCSKLIKYIIGKSKLPLGNTISIDYKELSYLQNINKTFVSPVQEDGVSVNIPKANLPTRCVYIDFIPGDNTTIELYLDRGWELTFRINSQSITNEKNLKIDIQIIGIPTAILNMYCVWV